MPTTISALPPAPSRADPSTFSTKADAFVAALPTFRTQANALASEVNEYALGAYNSAAIAIASANFKGAWSSLTGALAVPASVLHFNQLWLLVANVVDVTAHTPGVSASWVKLETIQADGLGYNQTWQNVKSSRSLGTVYTNNTTRPICVVINVDNISVGTEYISKIAYARVDGIDIAYLEAVRNGGVSYSSPTVTFIVPVGSTYELTDGGSNAVNINKWTELR
jgi:hypothetical protein